MKDTTLQSAIAEISVEDFAHPGLRKMRFIFCDDQPNENKQGIQYEDFDAIMASAIGTPVKLRFLGEGIANHLGAIPIGHISSMFKREVDGVNQLVADATLFADDYPTEIDWLQKKYNEGEAPGISWELSYKEKESIIDKGITWLKGVVTRAAAIVRDPAYGTRTAILAMASNQNITDDQLIRVISSLNDNSSPRNTNQGGSNIMDKEELEKLQKELDELKSSHATALSERDTKISDLEKKIEDLEKSITDKDSAIAEYQRKDLLASRVAALTEAGIVLPTDEAKRKAKEDFYLSLSDEAFAAVKEELTEAIASAKKEESKTERKGLASLNNRTASLPKLTASDAAVDTESLAERFRTYSRTSASQSE